AAKPYRLTETQYLEMLRRTGEEDPRALLALLRKPEAPARVGDAPSLALRASIMEPPGCETDPPAATELLNHWVPPLRLLRSVRRPFDASVVPEEHGTVEVKNLEELRQRARRLEKEGQWVEALEAWARVLRGSADPEVRREALFGRVKALDGQGEQFLSERMLRALLLF